MKLWIVGFLIAALAAVAPSVTGDCATEGGWPQYSPPGSGWPTAERMLDDIIVVSEAWLSPGFQLTPEVRAHWQRAHAGALALKAHGAQCTRYTCRQLWDQAWNARYRALANQPSLIGELNHQDPIRGHSPGKGEKPPVR